MNDSFKIKIFLGFCLIGFSFNLLCSLEIFYLLIGTELSLFSGQKRHLNIAIDQGKRVHPVIWNNARNSNDPYGWRNFKWGMTEEQTRQLGAKPFLDNLGTKRFGFSEIELLPGVNFEGKEFWVDMGFYSHIGLASILIQKKTQKVCSKIDYENILMNLREKYGKENESKELEYPNVRFLSHVWAVGFTKIELHHSCNKTGNASASKKSFLLSIIYERRYSL